MAAFADINLNDGTTPTPVARTFAARLNDGLRQVWRFAKDANIVNDRVIKLVSKPSARADGDHKVEITFEVPLVDAPAQVSGYTPAPRVIAMTRATLYLQLPGRATANDRADLLAFVRNALSNSQFTDSVVLMSPPRG